MSDLDQTTDGVNEAQGKRKITWYNADGAVELMSSGAMTGVPKEVNEELDGSAMIYGTSARVLFRDMAPEGFSLVHAWFGENFPLARHSHSGDCLYYVLRGVAHMGNKTMRAGDGFFVPSGRPYTYRAGVGGVEVLEFRAANTFDVTSYENTPERWESFEETAQGLKDVWVPTQPDWVKNLLGDFMAAMAAPAR